MSIELEVRGWNLEQADRLAEAVIEAGRLRLRPILMTTTTTVLGLLSLAIGIGAGAEIQVELARTIIGGLIAATLVTLLLIPVVYITLTRIANRMRARLQRLRPRPRRARAGARGDRLTPPPSDHHTHLLSSWVGASGHGGLAVGTGGERDRAETRPQGDS